ncbi:MAG: outer membrane lipoprotein-sorting protein, partial [Pseudomonadota bacterium]
LTDKRGRVRNREALILRKTGAQVRSTRITYLAPKAVRELTFLSKDYLQVTRSDERWLYIPAVGKVRRIPASSRGDYFLGTDFTFEDMQSDLKFNLQDYNFTYADKVDYASRPAHKISGLPVSKKVARQLGYGRFSAIVDEQTWFPLKIEFFDVKDKPLKTVVVDGLKKVDNYWTPTTIQASNHRSGHTTLFEYIQVEHPEQLGANLFAAQELTRGLPRQW